MQDKIISGVKQLLMDNGYNLVLDPMEFQNLEVNTFTRAQYPIAIVAEDKIRPGGLTRNVNKLAQVFTMYIATILWADTTEIQAAARPDRQNLLYMVGGNEQLKSIVDLDPGEDIIEFKWVEDQIYFLKNAVARETKPCGGNEMKLEVEFRTPRKRPT